MHHKRHQNVFYLQMNVIVSSSRGGPLKRRLPPGTTVNSTPGGKLKGLTNTAVRLLPPPHRLPNKTHVYFVCGVPDITEKIDSTNRRHYNYREIIYVSDPARTIEKLKTQFETTQSEILQHGVIPIFATIPKFNLSIYNLYLRKTNRTSVLYHTDHYKEMQNITNTIINELNGHLSKLNKKVKMSTPFLHDTITEYRGHKQECYLIYRWDLLRNGLHASDVLADKWASVLQNCFRLNRQNDDSDDVNRSLKRSWRRESKAPRLE